MKIMLDNGHGTPVIRGGKLSPDGRLREPIWAREIVKRVHEQLKAMGYDSMRLVPEDTDVPLNQRTRRVNDVCKILGTKNCVLVSVHINAGPEDNPKLFVARDKYGAWKTCNGFSVFVAPNASQNSKNFADIVFDEVKSRGLATRQPMPNQKYWVKSLAMVRDTNCPAILVENFFMDNKNDCEWLMSEAGKSEVVNYLVCAIIKYVKTYGKK